MASLSISVLDRPGSLLMALSSYSGVSRTARPVSTCPERRGRPYRVGDAVSEPDELDGVFGVSPFWAQSEYEIKGRIVGVGVVVV